MRSEHLTLKQLLLPSTSFILKIEALQEMRNTINERLSRLDTLTRDTTDPEIRDALSLEKKEKNQVFKDLTKCTDLSLKFAQLQQTDLETKWNRLTMFEKTVSPENTNTLEIQQTRDDHLNELSKAYSSFKRQVEIYEEELKSILPLPIEKLTDKAKLIWTQSEFSKELLSKEYGPLLTPIEQSNCVVLRLEAIGAATSIEYKALVSAMNEYQSMESKFSTKEKELKLRVQNENAFGVIIKNLTIDTRFPAAEEKFKEFEKKHEAIKAIEKIIAIKPSAEQEDLRRQFQAAVSLEIKNIALYNIQDETINRIKKINEILTGDALTDEKIQIKLQIEKIAKETLLGKIQDVFVKQSEFNRLKEKMILAHTLYTNSLIAKGKNNSKSIEQYHAELENNFKKAHALFIAAIPTYERAIENEIEESGELSEVSKLCLYTSNLYTEIQEKDFSLLPSQKASCLLARLTAVGADESKEFIELAAALENYKIKPSSQKRLALLQELCIDVVPKIVTLASSNTTWKNYPAEKYFDINTEIYEKVKTYVFLKNMKKQSSHKSKSLSEEYDKSKKDLAEKKDDNNDYNLALFEFNLDKAKQEINAALAIVEDPNLFKNLIKKHDEVILTHSLILMVSANKDYQKEHKKLTAIYGTLAKKRATLLAAKSSADVFEAKKEALNAVLIYEQQAKITEKYYIQYSPEATKNKLEEEKGKVQSKLAEQKREMLQPESKGKPTSQLELAAIDRLKISEITEKIQDRMSAFTTVAAKANYVKAILSLLGVNKPFIPSYLAEIKKSNLFTPTDYAVLFEDTTGNPSPVANAISKKLVLLQQTEMALIKFRETQKRSAFAKLFTKEPKEIQELLNTIEELKTKINNMCDIALKVITNTCSVLLKSGEELPDILNIKPTLESPVSSMQTAPTSSPARESKVDLIAFRDKIKELDKIYPDEDMSSYRAKGFEKLFIKRWDEDYKALNAVMEQIKQHSPTDYAAAQKVANKIKLKLNSVENQINTDKPSVEGKITVTFHSRRKS